MMTRITNLIVLFLIVHCGHQLHSQIVQKTGDLYAEISNKISTLPPDTGNHYTEPSLEQLNTWKITLELLLSGNYSAASDSARSIGYQLVAFTDTIQSGPSTYYLFETKDTNYWGSYVFNPNYCRALVIQSPHAKKDANTGHQGIHVFLKTEALFYQVNGTHRCNSSISSSCTGTTTGCSGSSAPYPISDLSHVTQSLFQKTTEVLFQSFQNTYFIQLHGFAKQSTDPYVILSNGTQDRSVPDYHFEFKNNLHQEDTVLTFKIAHVDTQWTRLRGFWNTQGRLINGSTNACSSNATSTNGRFFHLEQERTRLRDDAAGWDKVANALNSTFACAPSSVSKFRKVAPFKIYPNPASQLVTIECHTDNCLDPEQFIYNSLGQNLSPVVPIQHISAKQAELDLSVLPKGVYLLRVLHSTERLYKQ